MMKRQQKLEKSPKFSYFWHFCPFWAKKCYFWGLYVDQTSLNMVIRLVLIGLYLLSLIFYWEINHEEFKLKKSTKYSHFLKKGYSRPVWPMIPPFFANFDPRNRFLRSKNITYVRLNPIRWLEVWIDDRYWYIHYLEAFNVWLILTAKLLIFYAN